MTTELSTHARWIERGAGVRALSDRAVVHVRGADARTWLNGQITQDVRATRPGDAVYALAVSVKGRVLADLFVLDRGERGLAMTLPRAEIDGLLQHFDKYIIMEDVALEVDGTLALVTVQGPRAGEVVEGREAYPCDRLGRGGFDVLVPAERRDAELEALAARARQVEGGGPVGDEGWDLARLRARRPALFVDFGPNTYPQEAGLASRAVSFQKGCYLGQEVVCMLEHRGQIVRRLVAIESTAALARADAIVDAEGARIGEVTSAAWDPERGAAIGLGFVKRAFAMPGLALRTERGELRVTAVVDG